MVGDRAPRRQRRVFVSVQCKSTGAAGSSFVEPEIAKQIAIYLADFERSRGGTPIAAEDVPALRNTIVHRPDIVFSPGSVKATSLVRPVQDMDVDLMFEVPQHTPLARAPVPEVPAAGETILSYLCEPDRLEAMLGCLEQNFRRRAAKHGCRAARRYYWFQVARAAVSFGLDALQRLDLLRSLLDKLRF